MTARKTRRRRMDARSPDASPHHRRQHRCHMHALGTLLGVGVAATHGQRRPARRTSAVSLSPLAGASRLSLSSTVSTSASFGIRVSAA